MVCKKEREMILVAQFVVWRERCARVKQDEGLVDEVTIQWRTLNLTNTVANESNRIELTLV